MTIVNFETLENKLIKLRNELVLVDKDIAELFGVETRDINKAVKNNPSKFPKEYLFETTKEEFEVLRGKFSTAKFAKTRTLPKAFTEKGLYMLATILKSKNALDATFTIIETFAKVKELSRNINNIMKTENEDLQKDLAQKSNKILEEIIEIEPDILENDEDGEVVELYGIETREINQVVSNNLDKFPNGYIVELTKNEKQEVIKNFDHLSKLKYSPHLPKIFTEKGVYVMLNTKFFTQGHFLRSILNGEAA